MRSGMGLVLVTMALLTVHVYGQNGNGQSPCHRTNGGQLICNLKADDHWKHGEHSPSNRRQYANLQQNLSRSMDDTPTSYNFVMFGQTTTSNVAIFSPDTSEKGVDSINHCEKDCHSKNLQFTAADLNDPEIEDAKYFFGKRWSTAIIANDQQFKSVVKILQEVRKAQVETPTPIHGHWYTDSVIYQPYIGLRRRKGEARFKWVGVRQDTHGLPRFDPITVAFEQDSTLPPGDTPFIDSDGFSMPYHPVFFRRWAYPKENWITCVQLWAETRASPDVNFTAWLQSMGWSGREDTKRFKTCDQEYALDHPNATEDECVIMAYNSTDHTKDGYFKVMPCDPFPASKRAGNCICTATCPWYSDEACAKDFPNDNPYETGGKGNYCMDDGAVVVEYYKDPVACICRRRETRCCTYCSKNTIPYVHSELNVTASQDSQPPAVFWGTEGRLIPTECRAPCTSEERQGVNGLAPNATKDGVHISSGVGSNPFNPAFHRTWKLCRPVLFGNGQTPDAHGNCPATPVMVNFGDKSQTILKDQAGQDFIPFRRDAAADQN